MTTMTVSHGIAKINKTGVVCACGHISADRLAHREHKAGSPLGSVVEVAPVVAWTKLVFETSTCARCGGSGYIQAFSGIYGGQCFGCSGSGVRYTPAGRAAKKLYNELMGAAIQEVPASSLVAGQRIFGSRDAAVAGRERRTVVSVEPTSQKAPSYVGASDIRCQKVVMVGVHTAYVRPEAAVSRAIMEEVARRRKGATLV